MVKRAYVELRERAGYLKRLVSYTITEKEAAQFEWVRLTGSKPEDIDVFMTVDEVDSENMRRALDCYVTYTATIEESGVARDIPREAVFDICQEVHKPTRNSLVEQLTQKSYLYILIAT